MSSRDRLREEEYSSIQSARRRRREERSKVKTMMRSLLFNSSQRMKVRSLVKGHSLKF